MKNAKQMIALILALSTTNAGAVVLENNKMANILEYIQPKTLVVFDLDNTVMEAKQMLGSDQWFDYTVKKNVDDGLAKDEAVNQAIALWSKIQVVTKMKPVEATTPVLIKNLQTQGYDVLALTARPDTVAKITQQQLASMGVSFKKIIFTGPNQTKGDAITNYINALNEKPARVVFNDDKRKHTESVDAALTALNIEGFEFRYGAADPKVRSFDAKVAECQLIQFNQNHTIPSDAKCK